MLAWPLMAAQCSELDPLLSVALMQHGVLSTSEWTVEVCPFHDDQCKGVQPYCKAKREGERHTEVSTGSVLTIFLHALLATL